VYDSLIVSGDFGCNQKHEREVTAKRVSDAARQVYFAFIEGPSARTIFQKTVIQHRK
jgi:hypothetical protein